MPAWLKHAFAVDPSGPTTPSDAEAALVERMARWVVRRGLATPAIMALDCSHNLNFLASQAMVFFAPIVQIIFSGREYGVFTGFLERRGSIEYMCRRIEALNDNIDDDGSAANARPMADDAEPPSAEMTRKA